MIYRGQYYSNIFIYQARVLNSSNPASATILSFTTELAATTHGTIGAIERNPTREGDQAVVGMLDVEEISSMFR